MPNSAYEIKTFSATVYNDEYVQIDGEERKVPWNSFIQQTQKEKENDILKRCLVDNESANDPNFIPYQVPNSSGDSYNDDQTFNERGKASFSLFLKQWFMHLW